MLYELPAETTEYEFKVALETKKPKSWLKSVCAFANGIGGTLIFGIDDDRNVVGLSKPQEDAEKISRLIKDRITPTPDFKLEPEAIEDKTILKVMVKTGRSTPYYYRADGIMETYIRIGNESIVAPQQHCKRTYIERNQPVVRCSDYRREENRLQLHPTFRHIQGANRIDP